MQRGHSHSPLGISGWGRLGGASGGGGLGGGRARPAGVVTGLGTRGGGGGQGGMGVREGRGRGGADRRRAQGSRGVLGEPDRKEQKRSVRQAELERTETKVKVCSVSGHVTCFWVIDTHTDRCWGRLSAHTELAGRENTDREAEFKHRHNKKPPLQNTQTLPTNKAHIYSS